MTIPRFTPKTKKPELYSDIRKDLLVSPVSGDVALYKNEASVKESIKNLILTDRGERLMRPNIGSDIRSMLFDNMTPATIKLIEEKVRSTINTYEPRAEIINVKALANYDESTVKVTINFYVSNVDKPVTLDVILERIR